MTRFALYLIALYVLVAAFGMFSVWNIVHAHSGGLAKDGCHRDKAANERHWHIPETRKRAGSCLGKDKMLEPRLSLRCAQWVAFIANGNGNAPVQVVPQVILSRMIKDCIGEEVDPHKFSPPPGPPPGWGEKGA